MVNRRKFPRLSVAGMVAATLLLALVSANAAHAQTFSVIHSFSGPDGDLPKGGLTIDRAGNLYGTTFAGFLGFGWGSVYQLRPHQQGWLFSVIQVYDGQPLDRPAIGPNGTLYGTNSNMITVYRVGYVWNLSPPVNPCKSAFCFWLSNTIYGFAGGASGATPLGAHLVFDQAGNMYGTTSAGGTGDGVVYTLSRSGVETPIYTFAGNPDAATPYSGVIFDSAGNLYGVTTAGGTSGNGAVYKLTPNGGGWSEQVIYSFTGGNDGKTPVGGLAIDQAGNLFGTTITGGANGGGTVFELTPNGGGFNYNLLYSFAGGTSCGPSAELSFDSSGNLWGTTFCDGAFNLGNVFKLTNSGGTFTYSSIHDFANGTDGKNPISNVTFNSAGKMYGTTSIGGMFAGGNVWQITQ